MKFLNFYPNFILENVSIFNQPQTNFGVTKSGPTIAIQTNGTTMNPGLKLALETSLNKVLFGHKTAQKYSTFTYCDEQPSSSATKNNERTSSTYTTPRKLDTQSQKQDSTGTAIESSKTSSLLNKSIFSDTLLSERHKSGEIDKYFSPVTETHNDVNSLEKNDKAPLNSNERDHSNSNLYSSSQVYNDLTALSPSHFETSNCNNNQIGSHSNQYSTSTSLEFEMPSSVASSISVCSEMPGSFASDGKVSSASSNEKEKSDSCTPISDYDFDFERIVNDVENLYKEEQLRDCELRVCSRKENKELFFPKSRSIFKEQPTLRMGNIEQKSSKPNMCFERCDVFIPLNIKHNNNIVCGKSTSSDISTKSEDNILLQNNTDRSYGKHDKDTDILVENFAEVASNRALSHITDCMIDDILEAITATSAESCYVHQFSDTEGKNSKKSPSSDLNAALSSFVTDIVLDMSEPNIEVSFGGLYRHSKIMRTDNDYLLSSKSIESHETSKPERWKGSNHVCDDKCQIENGTAKEEKAEERTFNAGGSATNNPLYRMKLLRRRIKRLKEKQLQTEKVNKSKSPQTKHKNETNATDVLGNSLRQETYNVNFIVPNRELNMKVDNNSCDDLNNVPVHTNHNSNDRMQSADKSSTSANFTGNKSGQHLNEYTEEHNDRDKCYSVAETYNSAIVRGISNSKEKETGHCNKIRNHAHRFVEGSRSIGPQKQEDNLFPEISTLKIDLSRIRKMETAKEAVVNEKVGKIYFKIKPGLRTAFKRAKRTSSKKRIHKKLSTDNYLSINGKKQQAMDIRKIQKQKKSNDTIESRISENLSPVKDVPYEFKDSIFGDSFNEFNFARNMEKSEHAVFEVSSNAVGDIEGMNEVNNDKYDKVGEIPGNLIIINSIPDKQSINSAENTEGNVDNMKYCIEKSRLESTYINEKINPPDNGNYDPCTMIDDEPDSEESVAKHEMVKDLQMVKCVSTDEELIKEPRPSSNDFSKNSISVVSSTFNYNYI